MSDLARHWDLESGLEFLNHGSFGACPRAVLEEQGRLREELERQPVEFFVRRLPRLFDEARERLAAFVGADPESVAAVVNATTGVNTILHSLDLTGSDELLVTDHAYNACRNAIDHTADRSGAAVVVAPVPFPVASADAIVDAVLERVTPRTRLALIDHVTSPTGLILPVERIIAALAERGVDTLIDGAHAPGMLPLSLDEMGCAYFVGNCHKWICAPKGAGLLYARGDRRDRLRPLVISHGANMRREGRSRYHDEFDWTGTADPTAFLCVPRAIELMESLVDGGWPEIRRRNRELVLEGRSLVARALGVSLPCPDEMIGSLASLPLPDGPQDQPQLPLGEDPLQTRLVREHRIEVPIFPWPVPPARLIRLSAQLYNSREQYERLARALRGIHGGAQPVGAPASR